VLCLVNCLRVMFDFVLFVVCVICLPLFCLWCWFVIWLLGYSCLFDCLLVSFLFCFVVMCNSVGLLLLVVVGLCWLLVCLVLIVYLIT